MSESVYQQKISKFFGLLDANGDQHLGLEDFTDAADRAATAFGFADNSPEHIGLRGYYVSLWDDIYAPMDADSDQQLTLQEMLAAHEATILDQPGGYDKLRPVAQGFMTIADADRDGTVTRDEFVKTMANAFRVPEADGTAAFDGIDANGSGTLSHEEMHRAVEEFFCRNESGLPGNNLFGPLATS